MTDLETVLLMLVVVELVGLLCQQFALHVANERIASQSESFAMLRSDRK